MLALARFFTAPVLSRIEPSQLFALPVRLAAEPVPFRTKPPGLAAEPDDMGNDTMPGRDLNREIVKQYIDTMRKMYYPTIRGSVMATTNINIRTDSEIKAKAQQIFESLGLDMSTAINIFLRQTVRQNDLPFVVTARPSDLRGKPAEGAAEETIKGAAP
jgi:addiction module RelB/DinJ family antitoxin